MIELVELDEESRRKDGLIRVTLTMTVREYMEFLEKMVHRNTKEMRE